MEVKKEVPAVAVTDLKLVSLATAFRLRSARPVVADYQSEIARNSAWRGNDRSLKIV